ncbi:MAG: maleate cis-trans isomerase, partial [Deltaproteobacteria bacterium]|nr:maleate cis-trans isomerase [Deltaproteobacteria bacterium]
MLGWRGRIGLIIPSNNSVIEPELAAAAPSGVTVHGARIRVRGAFTPEGLAEMADQSDRAAQEL